MKLLWVEASPGIYEASDESLVLMGNSLGKCPVDRPSRSRYDYIKKDVRDIACEN
jgi:hypothetical protein